MIRILCSLILFLHCLQTYAQSQQFFHEVAPNKIATLGKPDINANHYRVIQIDMNQLRHLLKNVSKKDNLKSGAPTTIALPFPDGSLHHYKIVQNNTMHPDLAAKFPEIRTYDAYGITNSNEFVKLDTTHRGFHAMIMRPGKSPIYIDPFKRNNTQYHIVYNQKDFYTDKKLKCGVATSSAHVKPIEQLNQFANFNTCQSRQYRLAMAATIEYTQAVGGTKADAVAAQTVTVNRVNGIYETNLAVTLQLISNNEELIYVNPPQPYTSGEPPLLIIENQTNIDSIIGSDNYDIGHLVDAAGSGLAALRSVCDFYEKAMGVTGKDDPQGDPFDVDYVAHEIGHQFGANHTQNNRCQRNPPTAVEPGSGSTIMGYAGICPPNVQNNSDPYFHGVSLQEMGAFISSAEHTCPITAPIASAPVITPDTKIISIPANTPFAVTGVARSDAPGAQLTYAWEQIDNEISPQPPVSTSLGGPNFRSMPPSLNATRFLPALQALANDGPFTWEVLPSVSRALNFRVSVRNNTPGGSCNAYSDVSLRTEATAGPFVITYPNRANINWIGGSSTPITWNTANTNYRPVNAQFVDIFMSTDGGLTFPFNILSHVENNGRQQICVPNFNTSTARIMVRAENGSFFNVSRINTSITPTVPKAPVLLQANRNPMRTTEAYVNYGDCIPLSEDTYTVNGLNNVTIRLDNKNNRFIIGNITTPRKTLISITATDANNVNRTSNSIVLPSILK
ncbi:reprolysin-like metallopeptidase [uncultured Legionella sp.]|uniref:reprolysin-like metallopeptidase n=1 Tax=uncultured Legionella sp. TaxID=210934 RepID=UPI00262207D1|nr:zinc-dependent metalloprotease family protein [uncultured Legionella sp.]